MVIGLVHEDRDGGRNARREGRHLVARDDRAGRIVRVAHVKEAGRRVAGVRHPRQVVAEVGRQGHFHAVRMEHLREHEDRLERRLGGDDPSTGAAEGHVRHAEDL